MGHFEDSRPRHLSSSSRAFSLPCVLISCPSCEGIASPRDKDPSRLALPYSLLAAPPQSPRDSMGGCNSMIMVGSGENARGIDLGNGLTLRLGRHPQSPRQSPRKPCRLLNSDEGDGYDFMAHQAGSSRPDTVNIEEGIPEPGEKMQVWTWEELEEESQLEEDSFSVKRSSLEPLNDSTVVPRKSRSRLNDFQAQDTRYVCARACVRACLPACVLRACVMAACVMPACMHACVCACMHAFTDTHVCMHLARR